VVTFHQQSRSTVSLRLLFANVLGTVFIDSGKKANKKKQEKKSLRYQAKFVCIVRSPSSTMKLLSLQRERIRPSGK
jgi:hypothetical protein